MNRFAALMLMSALLAFSIHAAEESASWWGEQRARDLRAEKLPQPYEGLERLYPPMPKPGPIDWLAEHTEREERGQFLSDYLASRPVRAGKHFKAIYIQPLGPLTKTEERIIQETGDYVQRHFGVPTKILGPMALTAVPESARRKNPYTGQEQLLTTYLLESVLAPRRPQDAVAYVAFTASDLWPGRGWNFVFGQASLNERVGVWSLHRNGNPDASPEEYKLVLLRTMKTAVHEIGHTLSMPHCVGFQCVMNGSNHRGESDRQPVALCPPCLAKVCWNTGREPAEHFRQVMEFCEKHALKEEAAFFRKALEALGTEVTNGK
ncbi:MAG: archaemetzincin [Verrucomicrobiota bacterium]